MSQARNRNSLWAYLIVEECVRLGCDTFFISPGLRSSPLVAAIGRHERTRSIVHFDERGSAFAALGYGRKARRPGVWVTTSGTALANGFPAVIEASVDGVPLLLLTADRPPELRETGANQTIPQPGLFGDKVRWFFDLPTPTDEIDPAFVLTTMDQAVSRTLQQKGPVHVNCMFREPLEPGRTASLPEASTPAIERWKSSNSPFTTYARKSDEGGVSGEISEQLSEQFRGSKRPLCILGRSDDHHTGAAIIRWARKAGIPVLPDVLSGFRLGEADAPVIPYYDLMLSSESLRSRCIPDAVLQSGRMSVSKRLARFVEESDPTPFVVVAAGPERMDPNHRVSNVVDGFWENALGDAPMVHPMPDVEPGWLDKWMEGSRIVDTWLKEKFAIASNPEWSEQAIASGLSELMPAGDLLVLASSLSIRHVDSFARGGGNRVVVVANRGASGIDGTIATAIGSSISSERRPTVLLGDQAFLHDLNSLGMATDLDMTIVVINNDGGGIFSYLPIGNHEDIFEPYFAAPHGRSFGDAAKLFGLSYACPSTVKDFSDAYLASIESTGATLIEVRTNRDETRRCHQECLHELDQRLSL